MKKFSITIVISTFVAGSWLFASSASALSSSSYQIPIDTLGGGGGRSSSSSYTIDDVVGDVPGGKPTSSSYQLREGFAPATTPDPVASGRRLFFSGSGGGGFAPVVVLPQKVTITATNRDVTITWIDHEDITRIDILRDHTPVPGLIAGEPVTIVEKGIQKFVDQKVEFGKTYQYQLRVHDTQGRQTLMDILKATVSYAAVTLPNISELNVLPADRSVTLVWKNPVDDRVKTIRIQRATTGAPTTPTEGVTVFEGTGASFTDTLLTNGTKYFYTVFVLDGQGGYSGGALIDGTPAAPALPPVPSPLPTLSPVQQEIQQEKPKEEVPSHQILPEPVRFTVSATGGGQGTVTKEDGATVAVIFPPEAVSAASEVAIVPAELSIKSPEAARAIPSSMSPIGGLVYDITIAGVGVVTKNEPARITETAKPVTVVMTYTDNDIAGFDVQTLKVWRFDERARAWAVLPDSLVNPSARTVIGTTTHFSLFSLFGEQKKVTAITKKPKPTIKAPTRIPAPLPPTKPKEAQQPVEVPVVPVIPSPSFSFAHLKLFVNDVERPFDAEKPISLFVGSTLYLTYPLVSFPEPPDRAIVSLDEHEYLWQKNSERGFFEVKIPVEKIGEFPLAFHLTYPDESTETAALVLSVLPLPPPLVEPPHPWYTGMWGIIVIASVIAIIVLGSIFTSRRRKIKQSYVEPPPPSHDGTPPPVLQ